MPRILLLSPFPAVKPKHGGQVRVASLCAAAQMAGWQVDCIAIFPAGLFPPSEWGPLDIAMESPEVFTQIAADMAFGDFHAARAAARDKNVVGRLRSSIQRLGPDVILVEHPWTWLVLRQALPSSHKIPIIYSSANIEWKARVPLLRHGLRTPTTDDMMEATRLLEEEFARAADMVISVSDLEAGIIERIIGREVAYLPPVPDITPPDRSAAPRRFAAEAMRIPCRYAALIGSGYWPNVEGFFETFPDGLGFLAQDEQIWLAGTIGEIVKHDQRFQAFQLINESRCRIVGYVENNEKSDFLSASECVIVPVTFGAGAKTKTGDAIVSGRAVIATPHALEGYGPIIAPALGHGIYVADTPKAFRGLVRQALRSSLPGCAPEIRAQLSLETLSKKLNELLTRLVGRAA